MRHQVVRTATIVPDRRVSLSTTHGKANQMTIDTPTHQSPLGMLDRSFRLVLVAAVLLAGCGNAELEKRDRMLVEKDQQIAGLRAVIGRFTEMEMGSGAPLTDEEIEALFHQYETFSAKLERLESSLEGIEAKNQALLAENEGLHAELDSLRQTAVQD